MNTISILILSSIFFALPALAFNQEMISDDLVTNLSCQNVTATSLQSAIDSQKAFSSVRHLPIRNWSFSTGLYEIANCWSLSHSQRILFYLGRTDIPESATALKQSLNMIRKYIPQGTYNGIHMIPWTPNWFNQMLIGWTETVGKEQVVRNFKNDVQTYQNKRFHDVDNATYLNGNRERGTKENVKSFALLSENIKAKRLTNVLLRPALRSQHVVLAKYSLTRPTGEIDFFVYDSNRPDKDMVVTYNPKTQHFYAPEIVEYFKIARPQDPIGVFIVDEGDRNPMMTTLLKYYQTACEDSSWARN